MPFGTTTFVLAAIGGVIAFFGTKVPFGKVIERPIAIVGSMAVIVLALTFIGYPELSDFLTANTALTLESVVTTLSTVKLM